MHTKTWPLYLGLTPLFVVPVWAAGGTFKPWQGSFLWITLFAWICFFAAAPHNIHRSRGKRLNQMVRDPLIWLAILFMGFLCLQYFNSGRIRFFDFDLNQWAYSPPQHPFLPWSIARAEAFEMIRWFAPILSAFLILRHSWKRLSPRILLWIVCLNGFLNALLSFVHSHLGWEKMYNIQQFGKDVYGSFGYPNHGAVFFILLFALALGLLLRELLVESSERDLPTLCFAAVWTPLFFMAANLSTSRAGILGSWLVLLLAVVSIMCIAWPRIHPVQRLYTFLAAGILFAGMAAVFILFTQPVHLRELRKATVDLNVYTEFSARFFQVEAAWLMWLDHPWYGVGGWGYRYLLAEYLPMESWRLMMGKGKANVHHDLMQFLVEFGLIGFSLLTGVFLPTLLQHIRNVFRRPLLDQSVWANPLRICAFWGLLILLADSQIDIPLRSPAVFIHGILLFYLLVPHDELPSIWNPVTDWKRLQPPPKGMRNRVWGVHPEN
ncbi:MAG: O-antigen ligase family protein [Kiritimatiellia bacterium]